MQKTIKRTVSMLLCVLLTLSMFAGLGFGASAETFGGLYYSVENGEAIITGVTDKNIQSIDIPTEIDGYPVTRIGANAFEYCFSLRNITIPNGVREIGSYAFAQCSNLMTVSIPNSVRKIGGRAFYKTHLYSVVIPDGVTYIGSGAFEFCKSLTNLTIPNSVTYIGSSVVDETPIYNNSMNWPNVDLYIGHHLIRVSANQTDAYTITPGTLCIAGYAFRNDENLPSVTIPDSVVSIGDYAFENCNSLTSVTIPNSVRYIGAGAFRDCSALTSVTIPDSLTTIGEGAFSGCTNLASSITIPDSVTYIGDGAFQNCSSIRSASIGNGVTTIPAHAFDGCGSLSSVTIPDGVAEIGDHAFYCSGLSSVTIPSSVKSIGQFAFFESENLKSVALQDGLLSIGDSAFGFCGSLSSITIPDSVTNIGQMVFYKCGSLTDMTIPDGITTIHYYTFYMCTSLTNVHIPPSVTGIGNNNFETCSKLEYICSDTADCYAKTYADAKGIEFRVCGAGNTTPEDAPHDQQSVTIDDQISANLLLDLDARDDVWSVTVSHIDPLTEDVIESVEYTDFSDLEKQGKLYKIPVDIAPAQIGDTIQVAICCGEDKTDVLSTSVAEYCKTLLAGDYSEKEQALAAATLEYGQAANDYFSGQGFYHHSTIDSPLTNEQRAQALEDAKALANTIFVTDDAASIFTGASFMALTKPEFRFYTTGLTEAEAAALNSKITVTDANGNAVEGVTARFVKSAQNNDVILLEVKGIEAKDMGKVIKFDMGSFGSIEFSGNDFARMMAKSDDQSIAALGAALYYYDVKAAACFA